MLLQKYPILNVVSLFIYIWFPAFVILWQMRNLFVMPVQSPDMISQEARSVFIAIPGDSCRVPDIEQHSRCWIVSSNMNCFWISFHFLKLLLWRELKIIHISVRHLATMCHKTADQFIMHISLGNPCVLSCVIYLYAMWSYFAVLLGNSHRVLLHRNVRILSQGWNTLWIRLIRHCCKPRFY